LKGKTRGVLGNVYTVANLCQSILTKRNSCQILHISPPPVLSTTIKDTRYNHLTAVFLHNPTNMMGNWLYGNNEVLSSTQVQVVVSLNEYY